MLQYMRIRIRAMARTERGATAVEYGLLVALIAAGIVAVVATIGDNILAGFNKVDAELKKEYPAGS